MSKEEAIRLIDEILDKTPWAKLDNLGLVDKNKLSKVKEELSNSNDI